MRQPAALFPIALALGAISLAPRAGERHIVLTNNTHQPITEIYVADDGTDNWQEDGLGSEFLLPGNSVSVDIDDQNGNCREIAIPTLFCRRKQPICLTAGA